MSDILFLTPNMKGDARSESIGTLQLATIMKQNNMPCEILQYFRIGDVEKFDEFIENTVRIVTEKNPKIVSFYCRCDTYHIALRMAEYIKAKLPKTYTVLGGPQSDITAEDTLRLIPWVDFICCGEGENTVVPFFTSLLQGTPDLSIPGLVYRQGNSVIKNPRPAMIEDLDTLPPVDYSLSCFEECGISKTEAFQIDVGRGCPFGCTFCSTKSFWGRKYRLKSPQRIVEEVKFLHKEFGLTRFGFSHDMFTFNRQKVIETCRLLKTLDFPIEWGCSARADCIDPELIDIMVDSGMVGMFLGIETGSPRMQKLVKKNLKLDKVVDIVGYLKKKGVSLKLSFIYGFPEETEEDLTQTVALISKLLALRGITIYAHLCTFHAGTELSVQYANEMTPVACYSNQTGEFAIDACKDLFEKYPEIFQHMMEYKTELRTKLKYFWNFVHFWELMLPVYAYFAEKYPDDRKLDMYYDFVAANQQVLEEFSQQSQQNIYSWLIERDRFHERFADDENYDIISDYYRYCRTNQSAEVMRGETVNDILCFDPKEIRELPIQECKRCITTVTWQKKKVYTSVNLL